MSPTIPATLAMPAVQAGCIIRPRSCLSPCKATLSSSTTTPDERQGGRPSTSKGPFFRNCCAAAVRRTTGSLSRGTAVVLRGLWVLKRCREKIQLLPIDCQRQHSLKSSAPSFCSVNHYTRLISSHHNLCEAAARPPCTANQILHPAALVQAQALVKHSPQAQGHLPCPVVEARAALGRVTMGLLGRWP